MILLSCCVLETDSNASYILVVPQPVYMNMSDLERMRQQKQQQQDEEGFDLKTPTQEDLDAMPPSSSSDGSSSGYGSQNMVCEQAYSDGKSSQTILTVT